MFKTAFLVFLFQLITVHSKFYQTDIGPHGYGGRYTSYSTNEYDPDVGYPYGLSYKKYPYETDVSRAVEYEEPIPGPIGLKYGHPAGLEYPGKFGYGGRYGGGYGGGYGDGYGGGYYGAAAGFKQYPYRNGKSLEYGYGPGPASGYSSIHPHGLGSIYPHGRLDFYGHHGPYGTSLIDKSIYSDGKQNLVGEHYNNVHGLNGESINHGDVGFNKGETTYKDIKGDSVHFIDSDGVNRGHNEGKSYSGGEHFNTDGKQGNEKILNANHNKGHNIKGFKKSHHLDETGKTEEFFDQDHNAGDNYAYDGRFGKFGEQGGNFYKGGFNDGRFKTGEATKQGHYDNESFLDKAHGGSGKFGGNKFAQNEEAFGLNKGFGEHGLSGHHENSNVYRNYPVGYGGYY